MIDKLGKCPNCGVDWKADDALTSLNKIEAFMNKSGKEMTKIAESYGHTEFNPAILSKVTVITSEKGEKEVTYIQCPNMRCGHLFNIETGEEFSCWSDVISETLWKPLEEAGKLMTNKINKEDYEEDSIF